MALTSASLLFKDGVFLTDPKVILQLLNDAAIRDAQSPLSTSAPRDSKVILQLLNESFRTFIISGRSSEIN